MASNEHGAIEQNVEHHEANNLTYYTRETELCIESYAMMNMGKCCKISKTANSGGGVSGQPRVDPDRIEAGVVGLVSGDGRRGATRPAVGGDEGEARGGAGGGARRRRGTARRAAPATAVGEGRRWHGDRRRRGRGGARERRRREPAGGRRRRTGPRWARRASAATANGGGSGDTWRPPIRQAEAADTSDGGENCPGARWKRARVSSACVFRGGSHIYS